jgi:hypothetical protein
MQEIIFAAARRRQTSKAQANPPKKRLNACWRWIFRPETAIMLGSAEYYLRGIIFEIF